jgi:hypothetical protein
MLAAFLWNEFVHLALHPSNDKKEKPAVPMRIDTGRTVSDSGGSRVELQRWEDRSEVLKSENCYDEDGFDSDFEMGSPSSE